MLFLLLFFVFEIALHGHRGKCQCYDSFGTGRIFPLCELHNSNVGLENDTGAFQRHQVRTLEGENVCLFF